MNEEDELLYICDEADDVYDDLDEESIYEWSTDESEEYLCTVDGKTYTVVGSNKKMSEDLIAAEAFVQAVLKNNNPAYEVTIAKGKKKITPLALSRHMEELYRVSCMNWINLEPSEHLKLLLKWLPSLGMDFYYFPYKGTGLENQCNAELFNEVLEHIRRDGRSGEFKESVKARNDDARRMHRSVKGYVDALFAAHSRMLVLRVDFGYGNPDQSVMQVKQDLKHLFSNQRANKLFESMVGYVWRLEYGVDKGYHYHLVYFFHGKDVYKDAFLAQQIGVYWSDVVTKKRGMFFNCNKKKREYWYCGIGMVDWSDDVKRNNLQRAFAYLAKKDKYLRVPSGVGRVMGKGKWPEARTSAVGRPRQGGVASRVGMAL